MQSNAILVFSVDVHVVTCPAARLRLSRLPRASRLSQQLCWPTLRRLTLYACARFVSSSAAWSWAQAQLFGFHKQFCCVVLCASTALRCGHASGFVRGPSLSLTRVRRGHSLQPQEGEFSAGGERRVHRRHSHRPRGGEFSAGGGSAFCSKGSAAGAC